MIRPPRDSIGVDSPSTDDHPSSPPDLVEIDDTILLDGDNPDHLNAKQPDPLPVVRDNSRLNESSAVEDGVVEDGGIPFDKAGPHVINGKGEKRPKFTVQLTLTFLSQTGESNPRVVTTVSAVDFKFDSTLSFESFTQEVIRVARSVPKLELSSGTDGAPLPESVMLNWYVLNAARIGAKNKSIQQLRSDNEWAHMWDVLEAGSRKHVNIDVTIKVEAHIPKRQKDKSGAKKIGPEKDSALDEKETKVVRVYERLKRTHECGLCSSEVRACFRFANGNHLRLSFGMLRSWSLKIVEQMDKHNFATVNDANETQFNAKAEVNFLSPPNGGDFDAYKSRRVGQKRQDESEEDIAQRSSKRKRIEGESTGRMADLQWPSPQFYSLGSQSFNAPFFGAPFPYPLFPGYPFFSPPGLPANTAMPGIVPHHAGDPRLDAITANRPPLQPVNLTNRPQKRTNYSDFNPEPFFEWLISVEAPIDMVRLRSAFAQAGANLGNLHQLQNEDLKEAGLNKGEILNLREWFDAYMTQRIEKQ